MSESSVFQCCLCGWPVDLDDVAVRGTAKIICLSCYEKETGTTLLMPAALRRELVAAAGTMPAGGAGL